MFANCFLSRKSVKVKVLEVASNIGRVRGHFFSTLTFGDRNDTYMQAFCMRLVDISIQTGLHNKQLRPSTQRSVCVICPRTIGHSHGLAWV